MKNHIIYGMMALALGTVTVACNDDDVTINTTPLVSSVVTGDATTTATTAVITGSVADLSSQSADAYTVGVVYSTKADPTVGGTSVVGAWTEAPAFEATITGLQEGQTYYYATYVSLQGKLNYYGEIKSFVTTSSTVATAEAAAVSATSANLGGTLNGVADLLEAGSLDHGIAIAATADGIAASPVRLAPAEHTNSYTVKAEALVPNTTYHYAAYVVVEGKEIFGDAKSFTTPMLYDYTQESPESFVNMGTKKEWSRYNVGASAEGEAGALLGYGDLNGLNRSASLNDYAAGNITGTPEDVAVASKMGELPTAQDFAELIAACDVASETVNGVECVKFTSKSTGATLLFPVAGTRSGAEMTEGDLVGLYATGEAYADNGDYIHAMMLKNGAASMELAPRSLAVSVRPVRKPYVNEIEVDNSKINFGDLEGNGRLRIEIYNEYGSTGGANAPLDCSRISFEKSMFVTFTLSGLADNMKEGAKGSYKAGLQYADASWDPSRWSGYANEKYDAVVTGDGTYTVWMETYALTEGAVVFCIDIDGLGADIADMSKVKAEINSIALDPKKDRMQTIAVDNSKVLFNNKDGNGVDGRIEIYNEYGETKGLGADFSSMSFPAGTMTVTFTISGVDGNLKEGAAGNYTGDVSYAAASWDPSYWGGQCATANVTGNGTYNAQCHLGGQCDGAVVWCVELYGLWQDLVDPSLVKVTIDNVNVPAFAE